MCRDLRRVTLLLRNRIEKHLTEKAIDQLEGEQFDAFALGCCPYQKLRKWRKSRS
jgi:hypothetical protein